MKCVDKERFRPYLTDTAGGFHRGLEQSERLSAQPLTETRRIIDETMKQNRSHPHPDA